MMDIRYICTLILLCIITFISGPAYSQLNQQACEVVQITNGDLDSKDPAVCGNGKGILFISRADILNNGHPNQEDLFFADVTDPSNPVFYQLTDTPENERSISISDDCSRIGFDSRDNLTGGNPSNFDQMYYANISNPNAPVFTQLTNTAVNNASATGSVSGSGTKLTLSTQEDLTGMNPDGSIEFFIYDSNNLVNPFGQLTDDPTNSGSITSIPIINRFGSRVAFTSSENYIPPGNNPNGGRQLFLSQISYSPPNPPVSKLYQLTNFPSNDFSAFGPAITPDGNKISFGSNFDITGMNPDENSDLFLADVTDPSSPLFTQITRSNQFTAAFSIINSNASSIAFITSNPQFTRQGEQIILANIVNPNKPQFISLTDFPADTGLDDLSSPSEFTYIAFDSDSDLVPGGNTDGSSDIYIIFPDDCGFVVGQSNIPTLTEWGIIAMAGVLGIFGLLAARRRNALA